MSFSTIPILCNDHVITIWEKFVSSYFSSTGLTLYFCLAKYSASVDELYILSQQQ